MDRRSFLLAAAASACQQPVSPRVDRYEWTQLTPAAAFPASYNFPVVVAPDERFIALHPRGTFESRDGAAWAPSALPVSGLNSAYLKYVTHNGAVFAPGIHGGNYLDFSLDPIIQRTRDFVVWDQLGRSNTLPRLFFYAAASFSGFIWLIGGHDGRTESAAIWRSADGLIWERVIKAAPFGPRSGMSTFVFADRLWAAGGGRLDGPLAGDVWSSADGLSWRREAESISDPLPTGFTPIAYDGQVWLLGANRAGGFSSSSLVSRDGRSWVRAEAPWSPRGGVGAWIHRGALYITGGKYSRAGPGGEPEFIYSNDVWRMAPVA